METEQLSLDFADLPLQENIPEYYDKITEYLLLDLKYGKILDDVTMRQIRNRKMRTAFPNFFPAYLPYTLSCAECGNTVITTEMMVEQKKSNPMDVDSWFFIPTDKILDSWLPACCKEHHDLVLGRINEYEYGAR